MSVCCMWCSFFFKQKTAYELRISDWSSDVCSSDLMVEDVLDPAAADHVEVRVEQHKETAGAGRGDRPRQPEGMVVAAGELPGETVAGQQIGRASCRERVCQYG